jgi:RHS repeat-associated protein
MLAFTTGFSSVSAAYASGTVSSPPTSAVTALLDAPLTDSSASVLASPTVVRELTNQAGIASRQYLLSNGDVRVEYSAEPINYADPLTGTMKPIDSSLQDATLSGRAVSTNKANAFTLQLPRTLSGDWVSLETTSVRIALRPAARAAAKGVALAPLTGIVASSRTTTSVAYAGAFGGASLSYESRPDGVKETIVVSAPSSSTVYSFDLALTGLTPRPEADGSISLLRSGESAPAYVIPKPSMWDSADTTSSFTDQVHYQISGSAPTYRLDVVPDAAWLANPARVYPVMIDPGVQTSTGNPADTYITTAAGDTNYSTSVFVDVGNKAPGYDYVEWGIAALGSTLVSDMASWKNKGYNVYAAHLKFYWSSVPYATSITTYRTTSAMTIGTVTWNTRPSDVSFGSSTAMTTGWNTYDVTPAASLWQTQGTSASTCNILLAATAGGRMLFRSKENSNNTPPVFTIDYAPKPAVALTAPAGGQYWSTPQATWAYSEATSNPQVDYQIEVATQTAGPAIATTDVASAATSGPLPAPPGGWAPGQSYYAHMRVASQPVAAGALVWSDWSSWGAFWVTTAPSTVAVTADSTSSATWFTESDTNGDGVNDTPNDTNASGRGSASLSWATVNGATTYNVYLLDGAAYRRVGMTTSTSWTSAGAGIYPTDSQIASMSVNTTGMPYPGGTGLDLRDDPTALYRKMAGATVAGIPAYFFKVTAANAGGETTLSVQPTTTVQLSNTTKRVNEAFASTDYDLGSIAGDSASSQLSSGTLTLSNTDLSIASFGPSTHVSRTYLSSNAAASTFAPGWTFNFESRVTSATAGNMSYFDASSGHAYLMTAVGTSTTTWAAPHTLAATLTRDPGNGALALTFGNGNATAFDNAGRLISETDRHGDAVKYNWVSPGLVIKAANNTDIFDPHEIDVTIAGGKVTKVTNTQDGLTREVDYASTATSGLVTRYLSATETVGVSYSYADSQISTVSVVPTFSPGGVNATWSFAYNAAWLQKVTYPSAGTTRTVSISSNPASCTASVSRPARVGDLATSDTMTTETLVWDVNGRQIADGNPAKDGTSTTDYSPSGQPRDSVDAAGVITNAVTDSQGNVLLSSDGQGNTTASTYGSTDDLLSTTDPKGDQTIYTYTAAGDVKTASRQLNATDWAQTTWDYGNDPHGRPVSETQAIDNHGAAAVTQYAGYGDLVTPQTATETSVSLSATASAPVDVTIQETYNGFGLPTSETDPSGVVVKTATYDLSGRLTSETDATGTVTHHRYDVLGNEVETSRTAGGVWSDWTSKTIDPTGLALTEDSYVTSGGTRMAASTTTHAYDGSGNEIKAAASDVGTTTTAYDANGDVSAQWDPGAASTADTSTAQTIQSDADGRPITQAAAAATAGAAPSAVTSYAAGVDEVTTYTPVGLAPTTFAYDAVGDVTTQVVPTSSGTTNTTAAYDLAGRQTNSTDASGNVTIATYDLLGRVTKMTLASTNASTTTTYNALGWTLSTTDPNGVVTRYVYDSDGRVTDQVVSTPNAPDSVTHHDYDVMGNEVNTINPDGSSAQTIYDGFGRFTEAVESAAGRLVHDVHTLYDETGRKIETSDTVAGTVSDLSYATSAGGYSVGTTKVGGATRTIMATAAGLETTQSLAVSGTVLSVNVGDRNAAQQADEWSYTMNGSTDFEIQFHDAQGRIYHDWGPAGITKGSTYGYDPRTGLRNSQLLVVSGLPSVSTTYSYTAAGRLAAASVNGSATNYVFDGGGNIVAAGATSFGSYNGGKLTTSTVGAATTTYGFDAQGRRTTQVTPSGTTTYTWSPTADRLTGYQHAGSDGTRTASFSYDASGQRTQSVVTSGTVPNSVTTTTTYTYEGLQLLQLASTTGTQTTTLTYLYDELGRPDALMAQVPDDPNVYPIQIATTDRGDVVGLSSSRQMLAAWEYDAWGNPTTSTVNASSSLAAVAAQIAKVQPLRYAGYVYDSFSGLYYCSQRYYDPATMQFISSDAAKADGEESAYQYCGGDPVNRTDPTGLDPHGFNMADGYGASGYSHGHDKAHSTMSSAIKYANALAAKRRWAEEEYRQYCRKIELARQKAAAAERAKAARAKAKAKALADRVAASAYLHTGPGYVPIGISGQDMISMGLGVGAFALGVVDFVGTEGDASGLEEGEQEIETVIRSEEAAVARNPLDGTIPSVKVVPQIASGDLHGFPALVDRMANSADVSNELGGDRTLYTHVRMLGSVNGVPGVFHYIIDGKDEITHRLFEK